MRNAGKDGMGPRMRKAGTYLFGAVCALFLGAGTSHAALIDRGAGLIYDDVLNVTWLQDAGYGGAMFWENAVDLAAGLEYQDTVRGVVWDDWRLPSMFVNDRSSEGWSNPETSELAYMYYVNLGFSPNTLLDRSIPEPSSTNYNPFINLAFRSYWSDADARMPERSAWYEHFHFGNQGLTDLNDTSYVWLVRSGDVASVPEPATLMVVGLGLLGVGLTRRKKASTSPN